MRRARRAGKHHQDSIASDDSLSLKPLDDRQRSLHRDRDSVSPPSISHSSRESTSAYSLDASTPRKSRRWISRNPRDRPQLSRESDVPASEADVASLRIDDGVDGESGVRERRTRDDEQCESSERVSVVESEFEAETSTDLKSNEESDAVERLEELGFGVEETELSEELIRTNSQAQEDELLAMEYIYPDSVKKLDRQRGLQCFEVHINIEIPHGITVSTKLDSSSDGKTAGNNSTEDFSYSFQVQYLPPMVLTCLLPNSYPSHQPPYFTLSVQWLDPKSASSLCSMLDSIWIERSGQEIIYHWVEWLSSISLSYLGFEKEIILCPFENKHIEDSRAGFGSISPDVVIPLIKHYNGDRLYKDFQLNSHECCICFSEYPGSEFARLPCQHYFCLKCMKTFCDVHVNEGTVIKLQCPEAKCGGSVPPSLLKRILSQEEYERWESLTLQRSLDSMVDVVYCPRCETPCIEEEDQHAQCTSCFFSFCTLCRDRRHVGSDCLSPEMKIKILQERQCAPEIKEERRRKEKQMIEELKSITAILSDAKQCPSCNMAISKIEGCNKMVCNNCGRFFCYRCNKAIDGYDHYRNGACELFPQEMIEEWEGQQGNEREVIRQPPPAPVAEQQRGVNCPTCGQFNVKFGNNNHLFCWACHLHYCYLCKIIVRRSAQHYGPKTCKQHTDD